MRSILYLLTILFIASTTAKAASATRPSTQPVAVPFKLTETNHILIRVKINGKGPYNFIMDTGAPAMFVRVPVGKKIGLKTNARGFANLDQLEIEGGAKLTHVQCLVETPYQIEGMNAIGASGVDLDGLLGYAILARFRLQIDLSKDHMIWTPLDFNPPPLVSGRRPANAAPEQVDQDEQRLESTGGLLKILGPLIKPNEVASQYRGLLGLELSQKEGAVEVLRVMGNSPAAKAGVDSGDQLVSVNNQSVKTIAEAQTAMLKVKSGQMVNITVQRDLAEIKMKIKTGEGL
jgi:hypothetical protein